MLIASAATESNLATIPTSSCQGSAIRSFSSPLSSPPMDLESKSASQQPEEEAVTGTKQQEAVSSPSPRRRRHRHRFNNFTEDIPSFQAFQQQQQVRSLYRKFTRLVNQNASGSSRADLQNQIRREFRLPQADSWHIKRSVSEGNRRYKELAAMLGNSVTDGKNTATNNATRPSASVPVSSTSVDWPWNKPSRNTRGGTSNGTHPQRPLPFPPKSNL